MRVCAYVCNCVCLCACMCMCVCLCVCAVPSGVHVLMRAPGSHTPAHTQSTLHHRHQHHHHQHRNSDTQCNRGLTMTPESEHTLGPALGCRHTFATPSGPVMPTHETPSALCTVKARTENCRGSGALQAAKYIASYMATLVGHAACPKVWKSRRWSCAEERLPEPA